MICRQCGAEVDTRRKRPDGTVQCYNCRKIYYPRSAQQIPKVQPPVREQIKHTPFFKRRLGKLPVWLWFIFGAIATVITLPLVVSIVILSVARSSTVAPDPQLILVTPQPAAIFSTETDTMPTATAAVAEATSLIKATTEPIQLFPQTIFDAKGVKISLTSFNKYGTLGPEIKITVENNSGMNLYLVTGELYCDGWQIDDFTAVFDLASGSKAADTIYIYDSTLEDCGLSVSDLKEVVFKNARLENSDDYSQEYYFEMYATLQS